MSLRRWRKEHVIVLGEPPIFGVPNLILDEYIALINKKKVVFRDIILREGIGEETVEDQHCIELLSILSHFCQHLLSIGHSLKAYFDIQTVHPAADIKIRWMHRIMKCFDLLSSGIRKSHKDPLNVQVALKDQQANHAGIGLTGISFDDIYRSKNMRAHKFKKMFSVTSYKMCFNRSGMKEFEGVAENYLNGIYDIIVQETHNLSMSTEPSIIYPTTHLLETLPFNFIEKDWISLFNLDFAQAFGFINQLSVGLSSTWPYIPPSLKTMTSSIDWEHVRAEAEHEHHMRRMRLREENNVARRPVPQCEERKSRHLEEVL
jgi:hypothetical protein